MFTRSLLSGISRRQFFGLVRALTHSLFPLSPPPPSISSSLIHSLVLSLLVTRLHPSRVFASKLLRHPFLLRSPLPHGPALPASSTRQRAPPTPHDPISRKEKRIVQACDGFPSPEHSAAAPGPQVVWEVGCSGCVMGYRGFSKRKDEKQSSGVLTDR